MNESHDLKEIDDDDISLKHIILQLLKLWKYLLSQWVTIGFAVIIGASLGLAYSLLKKPLYKAQLSFAIEDDKPGGLSAAAGLASQFGFDIGGTGGGAFSGDNLLELMKSRSMVEKTLLTSIDINGKQQTIAELYIDFNKCRKNWEDNNKLKNISFLPGGNREHFTLQQDSILGEFYTAIIKNNLIVNKLDKKLSIITVSVSSKNELFSKFFVENLTKTVSDFYIDTKTIKSKKNVAILQHQVDSVRHDLNAAIGGVASSIDAVPNQNPALQILRTPSQRRQVDAQADQAILTELVKNLEIAKISLRKETPLIQVIDVPILPLEKQRVGKLYGMLIGGFIAGFLIVAIKIVNRFLKSIL